MHGSEKCWRKFINAAEFYKADILILGGDMTGKAIIPIIQEPDGTYRASFLDRKIIVRNQQELSELEKTVINRGYYPRVISLEDLDRLQLDQQKLAEWTDGTFLELMLSTIRSWIDIADRKLQGTKIQCFVCPGNDDRFEIDDPIKKSKHVQHAEGKILLLNEEHEMISTGWSNPTPWKTYREFDEEMLYNHIEEMAKGVNNPAKCCFNLHVPPYGSGLDEAPEFDKQLKPKYGAKTTVPVGSKAVRKAIEKFQPMFSLHGHIHESRGVTKIGRTLCVNPGSSYEQGTLLGAIIDLDKKGIARYFMTSG